MQGWLRGEKMQRMQEESWAAYIKGNKKGEGGEHMRGCMQRKRKEERDANNRDRWARRRDRPKRERPGKLQAPEGERQGEVEEIKKEKTKRLRYRTIETCNHEGP